VITFAEIHGILPHRYPMLLVDRVDEIVAGERLEARKAVTGNEPWYAEKPEDFRYPEVLLLESWCQAAGVLATADDPNPDVLSGQVMLFGGVSDVEYRGTVLPGDVLRHKVRLIRTVGDTMIFEGESLVDDQTVLSVGRATIALRPAGAIRKEEN
jgi:3-hydroxyacyl-[acyl-carrier-protein] dehydratase